MYIYIYASIHIHRLKLAALDQAGSLRCGGEHEVQPAADLRASAQPGSPGTRPMGWPHMHMQICIRYMYTDVHILLHVYVYIYMYICIYVCVYIFMYICIRTQSVHIHTHTCTSSAYICMYKSYAHSRQDPANELRPAVCRSLLRWRMNIP